MSMLANNLNSLSDELSGRGLDGRDRGEGKGGGEEEPGKEPAFEQRYAKSIDIYVRCQTTNTYFALPFY